MSTAQCLAAHRPSTRGEPSRAFQVAVSPRCASQRRRARRTTHSTRSDATSTTAWVSWFSSKTAERPRSPSAVGTHTRICQPPARPTSVARSRGIRAAVPHAPRPGGRFTLRERPEAAELLCVGAGDVARALLQPRGQAGHRVSAKLQHPQGPGCCNLLGQPTGHGREFLLRGVSERPAQHVETIGSAGARSDRWVEDFEQPELLLGRGARKPWRRRNCSDHDTARRSTRSRGTGTHSMRPLPPGIGTAASCEPPRSPLCCEDSRLPTETE